MRIYLGLLGAPILLVEFDRAPRAPRDDGELKGDCLSSPVSVGFVNTSEFS